MATFYGQVEGRSETLASRLGSKASGIKASVQSWDGSVITAMKYDENGALNVRIYINDGSSFQGDKFFDGTLEELRTALNHWKELER